MNFKYRKGKGATSLPGSLFSASLSRWNRDPGCGRSGDHTESGWNLLEGWGILSFSRPNVREYPPTLRFCMDIWSRDQPQPGSLFQRLREAEKRDPGNEVGKGAGSDTVFAPLLNFQDGGHEGKNSSD